MPDFHGFPTAVLENKVLRLEYLTTAGPRIVGLSFCGSPNLLADVYDITADTPHGKYSFLGGHRLWIAPEAPETTYNPDDSGLQVQVLPGSVELTLDGPYVHKSMRIELDPHQPVVQISHTVTNTGSTTLDLAPWVITMLCQGGTAILPQPVGNTDPYGFLSNRLLALWPYTRIQDPRLILRDDFILVRAAPALPPVKLGYASTAGWLAYWRDGILFRKNFDLHPGETYPDGGCSAEVYCGDRFIELESLGILSTLAPGQAVEHTETWELYAGLDVPFIPEEIRKLIA
jgi:hypothetical protein